MSNPVLAFACLFFFSALDQDDPWIREEKVGYTFIYQLPDQSRVKEYGQLIDQGMISVKGFFKRSFPKTFDVYVHPTRQSWDKKLEVAYQMPGFKSECWMVASGDGFQLNMISPATWDTAACEHRYADKIETQRLLTHELFHVFHGQHNASPDFGNMEGLDWLAEGFATFASGQLTDTRVREIRSLVESGQAPAQLDDFWKGRNRYGLAGSMVQYIDARYGREMLFKILIFNNKADVLDVLLVSELDLIDGWKKSVKL